MTRSRRFVGFVTPFVALWRAERKRSAALRAKLAELEHDLYAVRKELVITRVHLRLARTQAGRALALATNSPWSADDVAAFANLGIDVER